MKQLFYAVAFILLAVSGNAVSQEEPYKKTTGLELLGFCKEALATTGLNPVAPSTRIQALGAGICFGAVGAFSWSNATLLGAKQAPFFCPPDGMLTMDTEQLQRVYVNYLESHPEELHLLYFVLMYRAFSEAFPCDAKE